ncbi:MAG: hypothetical protein BWX72_00129 [Firmicutes bacterium ADurb.Bin080]|jgi:hypothetical protein|nr:hypothetical protein [Bacillota bacterium]OQC18271.1 MAG: hypothetical protein BWX72_00129 [Firmicutes bacterium ADurb.Bin080]
MARKLCKYHQVLIGRQMSIEKIKTPFQIKLDKKNRWVKLATPCREIDLQTFTAGVLAVIRRRRCSKYHAHSIENQIVSICQSHIRPIVRGKDKVNVEFGMKLGVSMQIRSANQYSWLGSIQ